MINYESDQSYIKEKSSVLVWLHDGGWSAGTDRNQEQTFNFAQANGWLTSTDIYCINYPLCIPAGIAKQMDALWHIYGQIHNLLMPMRYDEIHIGGYSSGAHLALLYSLFWPDDVVKVIAVAPPTDLDHPDFLNPLAITGTDMRWLITNFLGGVAEPDLEHLKIWFSPLDLITTQNNNKYLIVYNTQDIVVPYQSQCLPFINRLFQYGMTHEVLEVNDAITAPPSCHSYFYWYDWGNTPWPWTSTLNTILSRITLFLG